jgi:hypothetical protein
VEARDGIEPPNKALQTLPFSFWVPRHCYNMVKIIVETVPTRRVKRRYSYPGWDSVRIAASD